VIRSRDGQRGFALEVNAVIGSLDDDGLLAFRASLTDLLRSLTPESRSLMNPYTGVVPAGYGDAGSHLLRRWLPGCPATP